MAAAPDSVLQEILSDPDEQGNVIDMARDSPVMQNNPCPSANFTVLANAVVWIPPTTDKSGVISGGAWKQTVREEGCGSVRLLNVLVLVKGADRFGTGPLMPGTTRTDPKLQEEAADLALAAADRECKAKYVLDTQLQNPNGLAPDSLRSAVWRETWTVAGCGKRYSVPLRFEPAKTGTRVSAEASSAIP